MPARHDQHGRSGLIAALGVVFGTLLGALLGVFARIAAGAARAAVGPRAPHEPQGPASIWHPDWNTPQPARLLQPTYWPMVLALGISFLLWGLISNLIISAIGGVLFILALANWIAELRHEP